MLNKIINSSRFNKKIFLLFVDSVLLVSVILMSFSIRLGYFFIPNSDLIWLIIGSPIIAIPIFVRFGLYRAIIRYIGFKALWAVFQATTLYALIWGIFGVLAAVEGIPRSVLLMNWLLIMVTISGSRMFGRWLITGVDNKKYAIKRNNVLIYGAGSGGRQLSIALTQSDEYNPVAFIDNNVELLGQSINGLNVVSRDYLEGLIEEKNVTDYQCFGALSGACSHIAKCVRVGAGQGKNCRSKRCEY